jgi:hypothetical protein
MVPHQRSLKYYWSYRFATSTNRQIIPVTYNIRHLIKVHSTLWASQLLHKIHLPHDYTLLIINVKHEHHIPVFIS